MQAIARVNRIFRDKDGGLIVDYIGIGDHLKEATRKYTLDGGRGALAEELVTLNLSEEELAFYDVIVLGNGLKLHQTDEWIAGLVRQVVAAVRANLQVDWTKPHRSNVHAAVESAVARVLRQNKIKGEQFTFLRARLMKQAEASYAHWPLAA